MQIIRTRYIGPSNTRGSRIVATTTSGIRKVFGYNHSLNAENNHANAAQCLAASLGWHGSWQGGHDKGSECAFVLTDGSFSADMRFNVTR